MYSKPKLRTYRKFKDDISKEQYVVGLYSHQKKEFNGTPQNRYITTELETGRFTGLPVDERNCQICNRGSVEDEIHFVCKCPRYNVLRNVLYDAVITHHPEFVFLNDDSKFIYLMKNKQKKN